MLININCPETSIYYLSYLILRSIKKVSKYFDVYYDIKQKFDISLDLYNLCLDYLYIIDKIKVDKNGELKCL